MASITQMDLHRLSRAVISVSGELDLANVDEFAANARRGLAHGPALMLIDFRDCEFIDSSVIAALMRLRLEARRTTELAVIARGQPLDVLRLTGVDESVPVFENVADALSAVPRASGDGRPQILTSPG